jgi:hypothetical protein
MEEKSGRCPVEASGNVPLAWRLAARTRRDYLRGEFQGCRINIRKKRQWVRLPSSPPACRRDESVSKLAACQDSSNTDSRPKKKRAVYP